MATRSDSLTSDVKNTLLRVLVEDEQALTETGLAERFGVSRGTIREVLTQLETQGLIERRRRRGTTVRRPSLKETMDLWDTRCCLESMAARLACRHVADSDIEHLKDLIRQRSVALKADGRREADEFDIAFHTHIITMCDNQIIRDTVEHLHLYDRLFRINAGVNVDRINADEQQFSHDLIVDALAARDADASARVMEGHIQQGKKQRIESLIGQINPFDADSAD